MKTLLGFKETTEDDDLEITREYFNQDYTSGISNNVTVVCGGIKAKGKTLFFLVEHDTEEFIIPITCKTWASMVEAVDNLLDQHLPNP